MKKIKSVIFIVIFLMLGIIIGNNVELLEGDQIIESNKIVFVNNDQPVEYNNQVIKYSDMAINKLIENEIYQKYNLQIVNAQTAKSGLNNGDIGAVITIPSNFSNSIVSVNSQNPQTTKINYEINKLFSVEKQKELEEIVFQIITSLKSDITYTYVYGIFDSLHSSQEGVGIVEGNMDEVYNYTEEILSTDVFSEYEYEKNDVESIDIEQLDLSQESIDLLNLIDEYRQNIDQIIEVYQADVDQKLQTTDNLIGVVSDLQIEDEIKQIDKLSESVIEDTNNQIESDYNQEADNANKIINLNNEINTFESSNLDVSSEQEDIDEAINNIHDEFGENLFSEYYNQLFILDDCLRLTYESEIETCLKEEQTNLSEIHTKIIEKAKGIEVEYTDLNTQVNQFLTNLGQDDQVNTIQTNNKIAISGNGIEGLDISYEIEDENDNQMIENEEQVTFTIKVTNKSLNQMNNIKLKVSKDQLKQYFKVRGNEVVDIDGSKTSTINALNDGFLINLAPEQSMEITFTLTAINDLEKEYHNQNTFLSVDLQYRRQEESHYVNMPVRSDVTTQLTATDQKNDDNYLEENTVENSEEIKYELKIQNNTNKRQKDIHIQAPLEGLDQYYRLGKTENIDVNISGESPNVENPSLKDLQEEGIIISIPPTDDINNPSDVTIRFTLQAKKNIEDLEVDEDSEDSEGLYISNTMITTLPINKADKNELSDGINSVIDQLIFSSDDIGSLYSSSKSLVDQSKNYNQQIEVSKQSFEQYNHLNNNQLDSFAAIISQDQADITTADRKQLDNICKNNDEILCQEYQAFKSDKKYQEKIIKEINPNENQVEDIEYIDGDCTQPNSMAYLLNGYNCNSVNYLGTYQKLDLLNQDLKLIEKEVQKIIDLEPEEIDNLPYSNQLTLINQNIDENISQTAEINDENQSTEIEGYQENYDNYQVYIDEVNSDQTYQKITNEYVSEQHEMDEEDLEYLNELSGLMLNTYLSGMPNKLVYNFIVDPLKAEDISDTKSIDSENDSMRLIILIISLLFLIIITSIISLWKKESSLDE